MSHPDNIIYIDSSLESDSKRGREDPAPDDQNDQALPPFETFLQVFSEICQIDLALNRERIFPHAEELWKGGYETEDLIDFDHWWHKFDWRGSVNHQPPHLHQVAQEIKRALSHPKIIRRRELRARGLDPDNEYSDFIQY